jgi:hypothetical protein
MRSLSYRPRKEDAKQEETQEPTQEVQATEPQAETANTFDDSVVIS